MVLWADTYCPLLFWFPHPVPVPVPDTTSVTTPLGLVKRMYNMWLIMVYVVVGHDSSTDKILTGTVCLHWTKVHAKVHLLSDLGRHSMWTWNWILCEPIWKRCRFHCDFRYNVNEPLLVRFTATTTGTHERRTCSCTAAAPACPGMPEDLDNPAVAPNKVEDTGYKVIAAPE